jgi:hypothetical protein
LGPREVGLLCAEREGVPLVVAGVSSLGDSATEATVAGAVTAAERLARDADSPIAQEAIDAAVLLLGRADGPSAATPAGAACSAS